MIHINNRSDFSIVWKMPNGGILPTFPYTLEFSTRGGLRYAVKSDDATRFIPKPDADGQIRSAVIVFDFSNRPHLPSGRLSFTMKAAIPNTMYPDDYQDITEPHPTNVELWDGATDYKDAVEIELILPYVKGDKGDAGEGVPAGGRTGQVLKKKSDGDYDTTWGDDEGITDIAPGAVGTKEIAEKAVTLPKLGDDVVAKLNGYASKEDVATVANVATRAASVAADAQTSADAAANAAIAAGSIAQTAKETAESAQTIASGSVRYDAAQKLTPAQQEQVFANLGLKVVYINSSEFRTTLTEERANEILQADICIATYSGHQYAFYFSGRATTGLSYFTTLQSNENVLRFTVSDTFALSAIVIAKFVGGGSVRYDTTQNLTTSQQLRVRKNIDGMKNTPSGDPMHYMYETAGAEWIPYADISTDGLESWQINTLDRAQAQADGGVWWHNGIFVTVEQNHINYVSTVGHYPANTPSYQYYLDNLAITTNYKQVATVDDRRGLNASIRKCNNLVAVSLPNLDLNLMSYTFSNCPKLVKVSGILTLSSLSSFTSSFVSVPALRDISLRGLNANIDLSGAPNLSMTSIVYAVTNAGTAAFTITLAPAVYTVAMADADVQAALTSKPNVTLADAGASSSGGN